MLTRTGKLLIAVGLAAGAGWMGGCNIVAPVYLLVHGPEKNPAVYTLPKEKSAVVVVDDRASQIPQRSLRDVIARTAEEHLLTNGAVTDMIASRNATAVLNRERYGEPMTISEIGQAVHAKVVIYAKIEQFSLTEDQQTMTPLCVAKVRVVDAETGERMFPSAESQLDAFPLRVQLPPQGGMAALNSSQISQANQALAVISGQMLARMFYETERMTDPKTLKDGQ